MARSKSSTKKQKSTAEPAAAATPPAEPAPAIATPGAPLPSRARPWLLAVLSGVLLGLSQPIVIETLGDEPIDPTGWSGALALIGLVPVLLALRGVGPRRAFALGFVASFVQFTINVQWLVVAMVVFGRIPLVASWLILSLLTSAMACYVAAAYAITRVIVGRWQRPMWLVFPIVLCAVELFRNYGPLGGFPWGNIGTSFATFPLLLQPAALVGVYGLVFLAALSSSSLAEVVHAKFIAHREIPRRPLVTFVALIACWIGYGALRLATDDVSGAPVARVGLLQGNIEQGIRNHEHWSPRDVRDRYHDLQDEAVAAGAQLIVWPEAAFPLRLPRDLKDTTDAEFARRGSPVPQVSVVGAVGEEYRTIDGKKRVLRSNSAYVTQGEAVVGRVDKTHLVPFGEYVPWPLGAIVNQIVPIGSTVPGSGYEGIPVKLGDATIRVGTTICYEGIFPEISRQLRKAGAELHVNITNDGWYGISGAPTQHLNFYAMRAVESGMPVVRAANTGKSGWYDNRGRLHDVTPIYVAKAVVADVPVAVASTPYTQLGEWLTLPCALIALFAWIFAMLGRNVLQRKRALPEVIFGGLGLVVAVSATIAYFAIPGTQLDERNATLFLVVVVFALLLGVGALSGRPWGRKAHLVVGVLCIVFGLGAMLIAGPFWIVLAGAGGALLAAQLMRKHAYVRAPDPLVFDDV